jgi:hypothetical protein
MFSPFFIVTEIAGFPDCRFIQMRERRQVA